MQHFFVVRFFFSFSPVVSWCPLAPRVPSELSRILTQPWRSRYALRICTIATSQLHSTPPIVAELRSVPSCSLMFRREIRTEAWVCAWGVFGMHRIRICSSLHVQVLRIYRKFPNIGVLVFEFAVGWFCCSFYFLFSSKRVLVCIDKCSWGSSKPHLTCGWIETQP